MEDWRKSIKRKVNTKAFIRAEFEEGLRPALEDEGETLETVDKEVITKELIWHYDKISDMSTLYYMDNSNHRQQYKKVANNWLKKYAGSEEIEGTFYEQMTEKLSGGLKLI